MDKQDGQDFPERFHHQGTKGTKKTGPTGRRRYGHLPLLRSPRPPLLCVGHFSVEKRLNAEMQRTPRGVNGVSDRRRARAQPRPCLLP